MRTRSHCRIHPGFHHAVAGLAALADWNRIGPAVFRVPGAIRSRLRRHRASSGGSGAECGRPRCSHACWPIRARFHEDDGLRGTEARAGRYGCSGVEARLVILESETGSGKTEAALWRFAQLFAAGKVSGLYFAVPTRAAARQLHRRVVKMIQRTFGEDAPEPVLAIPGILRAGEFDGHRLPGWEVRWDDDRDTAPRRWAAEHATRFLAATIAVGTVDQAMLAGLRVKHAIFGAARAQSQHSGDRRGPCLRCVYDGSPEAASRWTSRGRRICDVDVPPHSARERESAGPAKTCQTSRPLTRRHIQRSG